MPRETQPLPETIERLETGGGLQPAPTAPTAPTGPTVPRIVSSGAGFIGNIPPAEPKVTREEIAKISTDPRTQKQLERLFRQINGASQTVDTVASDAAAAQANANEALVQLTRIADALSLLATEPPTTPQLPEPDLAPRVEGRDHLHRLLDVLLDSTAHPLRDLDLLMWDEAANRWVNTDTIEVELTNTTGRLIDSSTDLTDGAGAASGTLANAPVAGDPTKWIPIDDNGVTRYVPAW